MKRPRHPLLASFSFTLVLLTIGFAAPPGQAAGQPGHGAVATVHPLATQAGLDAFAQGGNAVDAAVAAALMLGVVDGHNSGIGGGCFALVRLADGRVIVLDGRETAPARATRDMFLENGRAVPERSLEGALAVGVPGELAALDLLSRRHGRLPLRTALENAARVAERGFAVSAGFAARLRGETNALRRQPAAAAIFLRPDGNPWEEGDVLRQPDLAATYRTLARQGTRWFYRGGFARSTEAWMKEHGGLLTRSDFARYRPLFREPVRTRYRDCEIIGFPPPSSGGVHVAQILNILEHFDLQAAARQPADLAHLLAESMKLAFADRARWLGDPDFVPVPRGLVSPAYAADLARRVDPGTASASVTAGTPPDVGTDHFGKHTTHLTAADAAGNWVAITATVNTTLGSKVVVPGTGVVLNNQMDDFVAQPGATNYFGLVGSEANAVAPGKRPLSSMSPTLVLRHGRPVFTAGAAGGPTIISQTLLAIVHTVDFGRTPPDALAQPRLHHQWRPDEIVLEQGWPPDTAAELRRRGHVVREVRSLGAAQAIGTDGERLVPAADPRVQGSAGTVP